MSTAVRDLFGYFDAAVATFRAARTTNPTDFAQIDRALRGLAKDVEEWLKTLEGPPATEANAAILERVRGYIRTLGTGTATQVLRQLGAISSGTLLATAAKTSNIPPTLIPIVRPEALALLGITRPGQALRLDELLVTLTSELEPLAAHLLVAHEAPLTAAASRFMSLGAEAVYGSPTLMPVSVREQSTAGGGTNLTLITVPVDEVPVIMRALQVAQHMVRPSEEGQDSARTSTAADVPTSQAPSSGSSAEGETVVGKDADEARETSPTRPQPADIHGLLHQASQLTSSIEEQWSAALKEAETWSAELFSQWVSVTHALRDSTAVHAEGFRLLGIGSEVTFPIDAKFAEEIEVQPGPEQEARQLFTAQLYAMTALMDAMEGLKRPTALRIDTHSGTSRSWWEAGAFSLVRARAKIAIKVDRELNARSRGNEPPERPWVEEFATAESCLSNGLPEAAVIYLERVIQKMRATGLLSAASPGQLAQESFAQKISQVAQLTLDGKDVHYGTYLLLANHGLSEIQRLVRDRVASQLPRPARAPEDSADAKGVQP
ncbi:hypothetical protein ACTMS0_22125 [Micromonospora sp. H33]|uniref:hypothetical protein n=1 Tax=Micromonospora sp. H33 TaxID=3452215 RepID=UPI003F8A01E9